MMEILPFGDAAILINFTQQIDKDINEEVAALARAIEQAEISDILYCTPAYCSITVGYDPALIHFDLLSGIIKKIVREKHNKEKNKKCRKLFIPVCYDFSLAPDLITLSEELSLSPEKIIQYHTSTIYRVFMLGFLPGFPYMGITNGKINCPRKKTPRQKVPAQSVGLAGRQTGIYPIDAPGGWQIIGQTPIPVFNQIKGDPFLFEAGDDVSFYDISLTEFEKINNEINNGLFNFQSIYG